MTHPNTKRTVHVYRYDPAQGGEGHFDTFTLDIPDPQTTTILDVLLRLLKEQDPTLAFRFACRVNMCGSCALVINGREGLACKTNVSHLPPRQDITLRPLNHFPIIKDLVVDMGPFFEKYEDALPFFEPKQHQSEPSRITPDDQRRVDIGMATDCIACGCCVSSCTMVNQHEGYAGPAALNRAFTLLADERDGLFEVRLTRALDSCYNCRTEFNCTEVCPKQISGTRAIKYIQRLALKNIKSLKPLDPHPAELRPAKPAPAPSGPCSCHKEQPSPSFSPAAPAAPVASAAAPAACVPDKADYSPCCTRRKAVMALVGLGSMAALGGVLAMASVAPTLGKQPSQWVAVGKAAALAVGSISTVQVTYTRERAFHKELIHGTLLIRQDTCGEFICFSSSCPHLGCQVDWDPLTSRFKCACHGGAFDVDGKVIAGPPPSPLPRLPWKVEDGILKVEVV